MKKNNYGEDIVDFFVNGVWIDTLTSEENLLLANYLKNSMAKKCKRIAFTEELKDGILYAVYRVKQDKKDNVLNLVIPGDIVIHEKGKDLPKESSGIPKLAFSTLFCLGEFLHEE